MTAVIQKASLADLDTLHSIEQQCFTKEAWSKKQIAMLLEASDATSLTAKVNGGIVGFVIGLMNQFDDMKIGHVITIDVLPSHRRKGIGLTLLQSIESEFKEAGVRVCYLEVRENNIAAMSMYRKAGYAGIERLENYYSRGGHGVRLEKTLLA